MKPYSMNKYLIYAILTTLAALASCKTVDYDWENYTTTATPKATLNLQTSALPTVQTAKVSFFNLKDPNFATSQVFEWTLDANNIGDSPVQSIDVYVSYNKRESSPPAYPITLSLAGVQPTERQFPLPSTVAKTDILYESVTQFPKTYRFTPTQLAQITNTDLSKVAVNDYFLFKFILTMQNGKRIVQFQDNACDESRGEPCDCRIGVRFKNQ
ncbi:hypothetical protein [Siphonobacter curvatus]|uniref:hypothetical protein n=1 Tax=Siphonobacter curvatus TaxID=2094562 RepID=UPI001FAFB38C|nr:hypothetical protein [Siphonobacter curvatus]